MGNFCAVNETATVTLNRALVADEFAAGMVTLTAVDTNNANAAVSLTNVVAQEPAAGVKEMEVKFDEVTNATAKEMHVVVSAKLATGETVVATDAFKVAPTLVKVKTGSVTGATAGNAKITGLTATTEYKVTVDGVTTLKTTVGTELTGLTNGKEYLVEKTDATVFEEDNGKAFELELAVGKAGGEVTVAELEGAITGLGDLETNATKVDTAPAAGGNATETIEITFADGSTLSVTVKIIVASA